MGSECLVIGIILSRELSFFTSIRTLLNKFYTERIYKSYLEFSLDFIFCSSLIDDFPVFF